MEEQLKDIRDRLIRNAKGSTDMNAEELQKYLKAYTNGVLDIYNAFTKEIEWKKIKNYQLMTK